ncbi:hypothetical protein HPB51_028074 [Rhipicephalus microplus]|uniref:Sm domain-containing protein n=1 Tax=Rhipicephalus microplus TaxID=6941 RepID=A0A9J6CYC3_RHIMP|nr:hypothetical protein HPB51_028074 [Rhipicephalus microplus]
MATETGVCSEHTSDTLPNDNPLLLMSYVHKLVRVETTEGDVLAGYVKTVDPISESVVLVLFEDGKPKVLHVIMGHAVKSVTVVTDASPADKEHIEKLFMPTQKSSVRRSFAREKRSSSTSLTEETPPRAASPPAAQPYQALSNQKLSVPAKKVAYNVTRK